MNDSITEKKCSRCNKTKLISDFGVRYDRQSGRHSWCNLCLSSKQRDRYKSNPEKYKESARQYRKDNPEKCALAVRSYEERNKEKTKERVARYHEKYYPANKEKIKKRVRDWIKRRPEKALEYERNRRALKKTTGKITSKEWKQLCDKYDNKCLKCGRNDLKLTLDHVIPLKLGGSNTIDNAQPLCGSCNSSKGARYIDYR